MRTKLAVAEAPGKVSSIRPGRSMTLIFITSFLLVQHAVLTSGEACATGLWRCVGLVSSTRATPHTHMRRIVAHGGARGAAGGGRPIKWLPAIEHGRKVADKLTGQILEREFPEG